MAPYGARWMYSFLGTSDASKLMHLSPSIAQYRHKAAKILLLSDSFKGPHSTARRCACEDDRCQTRWAHGDTI
jgi:hypothetical protein